MATTTAIGSNQTDLNSILQAAVAGSYVAQGSGQSFTVSQTIVININSTTQGPLGLDLGGGTIYSNITNGSPVIKIVVGPNVDLRYLTFANLNIQGNGSEGDGIQIVAAANDRWAYNFTVNNVTVNHVGGYGLDMQGSVFEGMISNSWMTNNGKGGAYFSHLNDGQVSALRWFGGGFVNNGGAGMTLDNGARDMSVDGAEFIGNAGGGINAMSGITSVANSDFQNNKGAAIAFQNYGNFTDNTFQSSGAQTVGMTGWLNGNATVVGNTSTWTGSGSDPTTLANLSGYGSVYATGDTGKIVTGSSLSVGGVGSGNSASVSVSSSGVTMPTLAAVTASTTAAVADSTTGNAVETALHTAVTSGSAHLTSSSYTVTAPIVINLTNAGQGPINLDFGGAKIQSNITNGGPVIEIIVGAGVNVSQLTLSNLMINGNGSEGDGIKIIADGTNRSIQNLNINSVNIEHVGGIGLDVIGNVHGTVFDSWMNGNAGGGARFANSPNGGVASGLSWIGGGFRWNGVAGLTLANGTSDMTVKGAYFVENVGVGIAATSGITLVKESGFENNGGTAVVTNGSANFVSDTFSTYGPQKVAVGGKLNGGTISMSGTGSEYYGSGSDPTLVANVQGSGKLAISGGGAVVAGSGITVTGGALTPSATSGIPSGGSTGNTGNPGDVVVGAPIVTAALAQDTGSSATDGITSNATLSGTADPKATIKFTVDGKAITATATADASGKWTYTPTGLADGQHTIVATETNASGKTGSATVTFTLDTKAPAVTEILVGGGTTTTTGALSGTTDPNAVVSFTIDGTKVTGTATADATGKWTYTPSGLSAGSHTIVASTTDAAGNTGSASLTFTMSGSTGSGTGSGSGTTTPSGTVPVFTGASYANGQITVTGTTPVANETVWIYDGNNWAGAVTSDASGKFSFTEAAASGSTHSFGAIAVDSAGNHTKTDTAFVYTATASGTGTGSGTGSGTGTGSGAVPGALPIVTAKLVSDTGASATDGITSKAALTGTADPNAVVHFAIDGTPIAATATADASGVWKYTPSGLSDGFHTVVASETNASGDTGAATLNFVYNTHAAAPMFTGMTLSSGKVTLTGTTGEAGDTVTIYDSGKWLGSATTGADGTFTFTTSASTGATHAYGADATGPGGQGHGLNQAILGTKGVDTLTGTNGSNDVILGNGGNDVIMGGIGADKLTGGSGNVTFKYTAVAESTAAASDVITDFHHGDKIDFTAIAGINASNGTPTFQGYLTGTGNLTVNAHSVAVMEVGGSTQVLVNTSNAAETITQIDTHAVDMKITLTGVNLGMTAADFHHN